MQINIQEILLTTNICLFLPCPCSLNTVILLWTLYYTKHRNCFHESLVMLEIFTKLLLKIQKFWFLYRQAVQNSLKKSISLVLTIFRASSRFVFQVTTEEHSLLSIVVYLPLLVKPYHLPSPFFSSFCFPFDAVCLVSLCFFLYPLVFIISHINYFNSFLSFASVVNFSIFLSKFFVIFIEIAYIKANRNRCIILNE